MPEQLAREGRCVHVWYVVGLDGVGHEGPGQGRMYRTVYKFAPTGTKKASWLAKVLEWGDGRSPGYTRLKASQPCSVEYRPGCASMRDTACWMARWRVTIKSNTLETRACRE